MDYKPKTNKMKDEKAIKRHYCGNGEGMFEDSKGAWVLYEDVKHLIEFANQHNEVDYQKMFANCKLPNESTNQDKVREAAERVVEEVKKPYHPKRTLEVFAKVYELEKALKE
jgi:hypothetical protein